MNVPLDAWTSVGASRVDVVGTVHAIAVPTQVVLTTSPANVVVGNGSGLFEVHNGTGAPVTIRSITLQNPAQGQEILQIGGPNCCPGLVLQVNAFCDIFVGFVAG